MNTTRCGQSQLRFDASSVTLTVVTSLEVPQYSVEGTESPDPSGRGGFESFLSVLRFCFNRLSLFVCLPVFRSDCPGLNLIPDSPSLSHLSVSSFHLCLYFVLGLWGCFCFTSLYSPTVAGSTFCFSRPMLSTVSVVVPYDLQNEFVF